MKINKNLVVLSRKDNKNLISVYKTLAQRCERFLERKLSKHYTTYEMGTNYCIGRYTYSFTGEIRLRRTASCRPYALARTLLLLYV